MEVHLETMQYLQAEKRESGTDKEGRSSSFLSSLPVGT